jgi:hypothetical protein
MSLTNRFAGAVAALTVSLSIAHAFAAEEITVFKSASCGCCAKWVEHLRKDGYEVRVTNIEAMNAVKARFNVPAEMRSCHTAVIGGYVIEGHVPASDIQRLLKEKPKVAGLAVAGMPLGSPGMEGARAERYSVMSFTKEGASAVFAKH